MPYSSSLTNEEWEVLELLLPDVLSKKKRTRSLDWSYRELIDEMLYQREFDALDWAKKAESIHSECKLQKSIHSHNLYRHNSPHGQTIGIIRYQQLLFIHPLTTGQKNYDLPLLSLFLLYEYFMR